MGLKQNGIVKERSEEKLTSILRVQPAILEISSLAHLTLIKEVSPPQIGMT